MTDSQKEQRRTAFAWSGGVCEVCGKPLGVHAQGAHKIANKEQYKICSVDALRHNCVTPTTRQVFGEEVFSG